MSYKSISFGSFLLLDSFEVSLQLDEALRMGGLATGPVLADRGALWVYRRFSRRGVYWDGRVFFLFSADLFACFVFFEKG